MKIIDGKPPVSYAEYLTACGERDSRHAWIMWKVFVCGMSHHQAVKAAYDPEWGWKPIEP